MKNFKILSLVLAVAVLCSGCDSNSGGKCSSCAGNGLDLDKLATAKMLELKKPIGTLLDCPLAFAGIHLLKENPEYAEVAYHYCVSRTDGVIQCVLYDSRDADARLIGIEYLVSNEVYQGMSKEEKLYWHPHHYEVDEGLVRSLTQSGEDEKATLAVVRTLWGKVHHTWIGDTPYPQGPVKLFWSATGEKPFVLSPDFSLPPECKK